MFVVDTNILVYAANRDCPEHHRCLDLLERSRNQATAWYTTWGVLYGFTRIIKHLSSLHEILEGVIVRYIRSEGSSREGR